MNTWSDYYYFIIAGAALLLSILGLWFAAILPGVDRWIKRFFLSFFAVLMLTCFSGLLEIALLHYSAPVPVISLLLVLESLLLSLPLPMLTVYLLYCCRESIRKSRLFHAVFVLWTIYSLLAAAMPFIDGFFYFAPDGQYFRGPLYPLFLLPMAAATLLNLAGTIIRRNRLSRKTFLSLLIALLPLAVTLVIHIFVDVFVLIEIAIVLSALSMYSLILSEQIEQDLNRQREIARHQKEIADQKSSIMVLQMRPHFIYNTMTSIYCLCRQDPEKARQVVMDFTTYLRKNFTAIASSEPIPFSSELDHTRVYLSVEQAQYEDSLSVEYDTPHTRFRVPPLTLQPIVENAVKHGRDPYAGPLEISIRTRKTDTGSEIVVADNGRGFEPADDSEPHIALKNIQQRLEIMCGGSLVIRPGESGGTVVTVTIPDLTAQETSPGQPQ